MTSHELAKILLSKEELPIYYLDDDCFDFLVVDIEILDKEDSFYEELPRRIRLS